MSADQAGGPTPDVVLEARGVLCPVPIIRLARAAASLPAGTVLELRTDDPAAEYDVPAWCRLRGHALLGTMALPAVDDGPGGPPEPPARSADPEPEVPNLHPAPAQRHLIRLAAGNAAAPGPAPRDGSRDGSR